MEFTPDNGALEAKRAELVESVRTILDDRDAHVATRLVESFCDLSPPLDPPFFMEMITAHSGGFKGGQSRKPGNLRLNWKSLCKEFSDIILTAGGVVATPWLIPFAALSIWNKFWSHSAIPLTKEQASALVAMWVRCDDDHQISTEAALNAANELFMVYHWSTMNGVEFASLLDDLEQVKCIEHDTVKDSIWLREWVRNSYT
jgi:hypothetical protein